MNNLDRMDVNGKKRKILVVEDNLINRVTLRALLEDEYEVIEAEDGLEGLEQLRLHHDELSLVLLDVFMPRCDGYEFLERKRAGELYDTVPVIVTTASDAIEDELHCLKLGANDFVVKPYHGEVLRNRVENTIHLRETASILNQMMWDSTTGLYSKEFFYRWSENLLAGHPDRDYDMVCSDIERFSALNDRYGEARCDEMLHELADALRDALPGFVLGGRVGGDVFAFVVEHGEVDWDQVLGQVAPSVHAAGLNVKYGIKTHVDHDLPVQQTVDRAVLALEKIKGHYGVHVALYDEELREQQVREHQILESMETALEKGQFRVYYQPKHDLQTGKVGGAEALVRWIHPVLGFVSPGQFIPLFERNGFITNLDLFVWEETCREIRRLQDLGLKAVPISINVSRLDFDLPDLAGTIATMADSYGVDHSLLHVELTETAYADNPQVIVDALENLRDRGFEIELDDFGAGYSALASLGTLPLNVMKLDMSIIREATKRSDFRIVKSAINLADILGLRTVAEGVELPEEVERLRELGCDAIQGYFYSKPLSREDFEKYLMEGENA